MKHDKDFLFSSDIPTHTAAFRSWKSMKLWVQVWLWSLNVIFWVAFFNLDRVEARMAVLAYLATGPIIVIMLAWQRGLTRLTGLIHIPFFILLIWLAPRLWTGAGDGLYAIWLWAMFIATTVCLVFDILDVLRWIRGEHYRLGTPAAVAAGASRSADW